MLEEAEEGLRRETREELEEEIRVDRLVWVCENFFEYQAVSYHELGLYFLASLPAGSGLLGRTETRERVEDNGVRLVFEWYGLDEIRGLKLNPAFLVDGLGSLPLGVEHVVQRDASRQRMGSE